MEQNNSVTLDSRKEKLLDLVRLFLESMGLDRDHCLIVGSLSLYQYGFPVEQIGDVDLELLDTESTRSKLRPLQIATDTGRDVINYNFVSNRFDFKFGGVNFNVFLVEDLTKHKFMYMDYFKFKLPLEVLEYKLSYRRQKDMKLFSNLMNLLTNYLSK